MALAGWSLGLSRGWISFARPPGAGYGSIGTAFGVGAEMDLQRGVLTAVLADAGTGINQAVRGVVRVPIGDIEAYVKQLGTTRELATECICAAIGRLAGLPIPAPVLVYVPPAFGGPALAFGSVAVASPDLNFFVKTGQAEVVGERLRKWPGLAPSGCFDEWIGNCDRHGGNVLFDGLDQFWLIDHGLSVHAGDDPSALNEANHLLAFLVNGQAEKELQRHLGLVIKMAGDLAEMDLPGIDLSELREVIGSTDAAAIIGWLAARQPHLVRLGSARIPAAQRDILDGGGNG